MALFEILPITSHNLSDLALVYRDFELVAQSEYGWPSKAIDFNTLRQVFSAGLMHGYLIRNVIEERIAGFMFYQVESYGALEIKVIYLENDIPVKAVLDSLIPRFMQDICKLDGWTVVSFPVLGSAQMRYINLLPWYGFKPVGQAVVKFHLFDGISVEILHKQTYTPLPPGYRFDSWNPKYEEGVLDVISEAFSQSVDALWDPRFRTRDGVKEAIAFLQSGHYGLFWPSCCTVLLNAEDKPVGVCFLNMVSPEEANIPLIGLLQSERRHKLSRTLLAQTLNKCIEEVVNGKVKVRTVSATVATDNIPAMRMYRHTAFQEDHWYPHVYQERSSIIARKPGQWC